MAAFKIDPTITRKAVMTIPEPTFTDTWHPIGHNRVVKAMEVVLKERKIEVIKKQFALGDGWVHPENDDPHGGVPNINMYACFTIKTEQENTKMGSTLIFRNSLGKAFSIGVNAGTETWACANLMVFGSFVEFRKHTGGLDDKEVHGIFNRGFDRVQPRFQSVMNWHNALEEIKLTRDRAESLAYRAIREKIVSQKQIPQFHNLLFGNEAEGIQPTYECDRAWGFHGACTELMQDLNLAGSFQSKQDSLFEFLQAEFGKKLPEIKFSEN